MHGPIVAKKYFFALSFAYFTICCHLNARKKGQEKKLLIYRQMKLCGKVKFMIYVSSNDAATVQSFIGIFENLIAIIMTD